MIVPVSVKRIFFFSILQAVFILATAQYSVISKGDSWKYKHNGSDQGTAWVDSGFNHSTWHDGNAILGYGNGGGGGNVSTYINKGPQNNQYATYYFRKEVTIANDSFDFLKISFLAVDGAILYINGKQAISSNMPNSWNYLTPALSDLAKADEKYIDYIINDTFLVNGVNTFAVETHASGLKNNKLAFDIEVLAVDWSNLLITEYSDWQYHDSGSNLGTSWRSVSYDDSNWDSGKATLGYGVIDGAILNTTVSYGSNANSKYATTYFRKTLNISNPDFAALEIKLLADDGAAIYINDKLAIKQNMPASWDYSNYATFDINGVAEGAFTTYVIPDSFLQNGTNVFAAEVHQFNGSSGDLGFNMSVEGKFGRVVEGRIFLDLDGDGVDSSIYDTYGSGAVEIQLYNDADSNGIYTPSELIDYQLTKPFGTFFFIIDRDVEHLAVKLLTEDMDDIVEYTTDTTLTYTLDPSNGNTVDARFGMLGPRSLCLLIADDQGAIDEYYMANRISGKNEFIAEITERDLIETCALKLGMDSFWACDEGQFGLIDISTGAFTAIGTGMGTANGVVNGVKVTGIVLNDVDGMAYDPISDLLYGVERRGGYKDLLFVIDRSTGKHVKDQFGWDLDFVEIKGTRVMGDVDDIAFNPYTGQLLGVNNSGNGDSARYITINPSTGEATVLSFIGVGDFEGMGYYNTGELYGTTGTVGTSGYTSDAFYKIDRNTGVGTLLSTIDGGKDIESCDCLTGPLENLISGTVFYDEDSSGVYDKNIDSAYGGIKVYLYRDVDGDGYIDSEDYIIDSTYTHAGTGFYVFITDSLGSFITTPVIKNTSLETNNITTDPYLTEVATFVMLGDYDGKNDFGFHISSGQPYLPVKWLAINAEWQDEYGLITWTTALEENSSLFEVQRSFENLSFEKIGEVPASGTTETPTTYFYLDLDANKLPNGYIYYRVRQIDFDNKSTLSDIVKLQKEENHSVIAYPTLVDDHINIVFDYRGEYKITLMNSIGVEQLSYKGIKSGEEQPISIEGLNVLSSGVYLLKINFNNEDVVIKIVKR